MKYTPRILEARLLEYLQAFPVVGIMGPRQSGRSTLLQHVLGQQYRYVTFDDVQVRTQFADAPEQFMAQHSEFVVFDEVQKAPEIFDYIKIGVDKGRSSDGKLV
jgi:predicted AAA+ superfamily ATPase